MKKLIWSLLLICSVACLADRRGQLMNQRPPQNAVVSFPSPFSYYTLNDSSALLGVDDVSSNTMQRSSVNVVSSPGGIISSCAAFPTVTGSIIGRAIGFAGLYWSNGISVRLWVNTTNFPSGEGSENAIMLLNDNTHSLQLTLWEIGGQIVPSLYSGVTTVDTIGTISTPLNSWTYVALVYSNSVMNLYVNGQFSTNASAPSMSSNLQILKIGDNDFAWAGLLDECGVWGQVLSGANIISDYNGGVGRTF